MCSIYTFLLKKIAFVILVFSLIGYSLTAQNTWYVNASASGSNSGLNWANAFTDLQDALTTAQSGDEIWVAAGVYKPTSSTTDRDASFNISGGISLFGGFPSVGNPGFSDRDWEVNITVLSGDIDNNDPVDANGITTDGDSIVGANSFHIIQIEDVLEDVQIDGFFISGGQANGSGNDVFGAAVFVFNNSSNLISTSNIQMVGNLSNRGGALYVHSSRLDSDSVQFLNNVSVSGGTNDGGGAMRVVSGSEVFLNNSTFQNNRSAARGGALHIRSSILHVVNCDFVDNKTNTRGGALYIVGDSLSISGSTFSGSRTNLTSTSGEQGGAIYISDAVSEIYNSEFFDNGTRGGGGALYAIGANTNLEIESTAFIQNFSTNSGGGAIYIHSSVPMVNIANGSSFIENNSNLSPGGGAIARLGSGGSLKIEDCTFEYNVATGNSGNGGAINNQSPLTIINTTFLGDSTSGNGGALVQRSSGKLTIIGSSFSGCSAHLGAAIIHTASGDSIIIQNTVFTGNSASSQGGAIRFEGTGVQVRQIMDSEFIGNTAGRGGAIFHTGSSGSFVNISINNLYKENEVTGTQGGGAIEYFTSPDSSIYDNC
ncbi:MAG: hypothetical protein EA409_03310, partial [Saprospirales bacterium]